ncbi:MAG TPA: putative zinc-binding metallopeptidase [Candidatus Eisenbacteria bacterium]|nr:putative zinc-binding metallopeptidase [Candidatus Eisenbacteria bacterium]
MKLRNQDTPRRRALRRKPIRELSLSLEGSPVEPLLRRLDRELERKLRRFRPRYYLTDEWGCPSGQPVIGIPFYLADPELARIEKETNDLESAREIMMYLRHEAGHAFNYAYRLYQRPEWRATFGAYRRRYSDDYRPVPFSREYVRHLPGWYAQKHPDEDFAETFAVWLTPKSSWRRLYRGWPAMKKLLLVDRMARERAGREPLVQRGRPDITADQMSMTVGEYIDLSAARSRAVYQAELDHHLEDIFLHTGAAPRGSRVAWKIVEEHRVALTNTIATWTGVSRLVVRELVDSIAAATRKGRFRGIRGKEKEYLVHLTAYTTALAANYLTRGKFHKV